MKIETYGFTFLGILRKAFRKKSGWIPVGIPLDGLDLDMEEE